MALAVSSEQTQQPEAKPAPWVQLWQFIVALFTRRRAKLHKAQRSVQATQLQEYYPCIDGLAYGIRWMQEMILVLSVPALTLGLIIGTFDFLSDGTILQVYVVKIIWTLLQSIVLDACFGMYAVKVFTAQQRRVQISSAFLALLLGLVAGGINYLQQTSELLHIAPLSYLQHTGFPPEALLALRAALSVVLLALGAASVARKQHSTAQGTQAVQSAPEQPSCVQEDKEDEVAAQDDSVSPDTDKVTAFPGLHRTAQVSAMNSEQTANAAQPSTERKGVQGGMQSPVYDKVRKAVLRNPKISLRAMSKLADGMSPTTMRAWKKQILEGQETVEMAAVRV